MAKKRSTSRKSKSKSSLLKKRPDVFKKRWLYGVFVVFFIIIGGYALFSSEAYVPNLQGNDGEFVALTPDRLFDKYVYGDNSYTEVTVAGLSGVPSSGVSAVVANITIDNPSADSYLAVYPTGRSLPDSSTINFAKSTGSIANQITVGLGSGGKITIFNRFGDVRVIVDISGYYSAANGPNGTRFTPLTPARIFDDKVGATAANGNNTVTDIPVAGKGGVPRYDVSAVVVNVTTDQQSQDGYVTLYPSDSEPGDASTINYRPVNGPVANQVIVKLGSDGKIKSYAPLGTTRLILDVSGYYSANGARFVSMTPDRIYDSTITQTKNTVSIPILGKNGVPGSHVKAIVANITAAAPTKPGYLLAYPSGTTRPTSSTINFLASTAAVANQVALKVGNNGSIDIYNPYGSTRTIVDISGYFVNNDELEIINYDASKRLPSNPNVSLKKLRSNVKYGPSLSNTFDIYDSANRATAAKTNKDTIVWFFGGGWENGDNKLTTAYDTIAKHLAAEYGYKLVSVNYRKSGEAPYPAQYQDGIAVIKYLKANAASLDIDPNRLIIGGFSAGGDIAATVGLGYDASHLQPTYLSSTVARQTARVNRIISFATPFDKVTWANNPIEGASPYAGLYKLVGTTGDGSQQSFTDNFLKLNIAQYASPNDPPHYTVMSKTDEVIPYDTQIDAMNVIGVTTRTILQLGGPSGHVSGLDTNIPAILEFLR